MTNRNTISEFMTLPLAERKTLRQFFKVYLQTRPKK